MNKMYFIYLLLFFCTEPLGMSAVFTVAVGSLGVFMICILLAVYIIKSHKCCFRRNKSSMYHIYECNTTHCIAGFYLKLYLLL